MRECQICPAKQYKRYDATGLPAWDGSEYPDRHPVTAGVSVYTLRLILHRYGFHWWTYHPLDKTTGETFRECHLCPKCQRLRFSHEGPYWRDTREKGFHPSFG